MKKNNTAILTIVSNNYLHFARTLLQSVRKHQKNCDLYCVIVDSDTSHAEQLANEFNTIKINSLSIDHLMQFIFQYTVLELNTAAKPWAMETLLNLGYENVIYIDPDIKLYQPLNEVIDAFSNGIDIVITPHLLAPMTDNLHPTELDIRRAGTYNFGFCAVKNSANTLAFIKWWQGKLYRECIVNHDKGIFVDQSWIDLVPGLFDNVLILKHAGYNVAYWNIAQRNIFFDDSKNQWLSNNDPLIFFHFSGLNPLKPDNFSKHQNRFTLDNLGACRSLVDDYISNLIDNGAEYYSKLKYGYSCFLNQEPIPEALRKLYLTDDDLRSMLGNNPFEHGDILLKPLPRKYQTASNINFGMYLIWAAREDLQKAFDLSNAEGAYGFWNWFIPECKNYYSESIVEKMYKCFEKVHNNSSGQVYLRKHSHLETIFHRVLGRAPGTRAKTKLAHLSNNKLTALSCVLIVGLTKESRSKPRLIKRLFRAAKDVVLPSIPSYLPHHGINETGQLRSIHHHYFNDLYLNDSDITANGIWAGPMVVLPIPNKVISQYEIDIIYPLEIHAQTSFDIANTLEIYINDILIETVEIRNQSSIKLERLFSSPQKESTALMIKANAHFVPSDLGNNNDNRLLSYRITKATINNIEIVNSAITPFIIEYKNIFNDYGINLIGYLAAELGIGEAARNMAKSLINAGIKYNIVDVGYQSSNRQEDRSAWERASTEHFDIDILYVNADQMPNTLSHLSHIDHQAVNLRIAYWHWEQTKLPEKYLPSFEGLDEVWVPSAFVHEAVSAVSPIPVFKVPHAVEFTIQQILHRSVFGIPDNHFAALVMYDFHSYRYRKNPEAAIAAFSLAYKNQKNMTLVIKTINAEHYPQDFQLLKDSVAHIKSVIFINEVYSNDKIRALQNCCDCLISLHRAEGFGFAPAEMMYLGKPVIATGWSGNMEFMNQMNSFPVNYDLKKLENNLGVYEAGLEWAEADIEHASFCLRQLINDKKMYERIGGLARSTIINRFNTTMIGDLYKQRLALLKSRKI